MRTLALLVALLMLPVLPASAQETEAPEGTRIKGAQVSGFDLGHLSPGLQTAIAQLAGTPLDRQILRDLAARIEAEQPQYVAAIRATLNTDGEAWVVFPAEARYVGEHGTALVEQRFDPFPGQAIAGHARDRGWRRIGVYGLDYVMTVRDYRALDAFEVLPFDVEFDLARAVKSEAELESVRDSVRINRRGFELFAGKGRCIGCHVGFDFTDHNFYDIALPGADRGRGKEIGLPAANYAFKAPTLRELAWTAPYMHDGSLATLEDVVRHYERGGVARPTRSKDLPQKLTLTDAERADLVVFLESLSSETPPQPSPAASATASWLGRRRSSTALSLSAPSSAQPPTRYQSS